MSQGIMFVNGMHAKTSLEDGGKNSGLKFIEIEFGNWKILNPRKFSLSGLLALSRPQEGCEWSPEMCIKVDFSDGKDHNSNQFFTWVLDPLLFLKYFKT